MDPWKTLRDEYYIMQEELLQHDTPIVRRNFIRSVCANVEGTLNYLMTILSENAGVLNDLERLAFRERQIVVKDNGEVSTTTLFLKTKTKIKMVFKVLSRYPNGDGMDLGNANFEKLMASFEKRDRLMHPRNDKELEVSFEEVQNMIDGYRWYIHGYQNVLKSIKSKDSQPNEK